MQGIITVRSIYTFANQCLEDKTLNQQDGAVSIFLSTYGKNEKEVPEKMVKFLKFVRADLTESERDFKDAYVKKLQESVRHVKESREMEERFMLFQEMLREERAEGKAQSMEEFLKAMELNFSLRFCNNRAVRCLIIRNL